MNEPSGLQAGPAAVPTCCELSASFPGPGPCASLGSPAPPAAGEASRAEVSGAFCSCRISAGPGDVCHLWDSTGLRQTRVSGLSGGNLRRHEKSEARKGNSQLKTLSGAAWKFPEAPRTAPLEETRSHSSYPGFLGEVTPFLTARLGFQGQECRRLCKLVVGTLL